MGIFSGHEDELQSAILSTQYHPDVTGKCPQCGKSPALFRCEECNNPPPLCQQCLLQSHRNLWFHHIQEWNGQFFGRTTLETFSAVITLGHHGHPCPNRSDKSIGRHMIFMHSNGFHHFCIEFCHCNHAKTEHLQLVQASLFPATIAQPETAFTFDVLDYFHIQSLTSKKSAYDYHDAIQKKTSQSFPQDVPVRHRYFITIKNLTLNSQDRYPEFNRVVRVWNHLALVRRMGQFHGIDYHLPHRRPNSLATRCAARPDIGFNVDKETVDKVEESET
jgi:hypothetical protein